MRTNLCNLSTLFFEALCVTARFPYAAEMLKILLFSKVDIGVYPQFDFQKGFHIKVTRHLTTVPRLSRETWFPEWNFCWVLCFSLPRTSDMTANKLYATTEKNKSNPFLEIVEFTLLSFFSLREIFISLFTRFMCHRAGRRAPSGPTRAGPLYTQKSLVEGDTVSNLRHKNARKCIWGHLRFQNFLESKPPPYPPLPHQGLRTFSLRWSIGA